MPEPLILASGSKVRAALLARAGIAFDVNAPRIDEDAIKSAMVQDNAPARDIADVLAEHKAMRVSARHPGRWVLGSDQVLSFRGEVLSKPKSPDHAIEQLVGLTGERHQLFSAAVLVSDGQPIWRHVGTATLYMRDLSASFVQDYVSEYWEDIRHCVGGYRIEEEGVRLFSKIQGDFFSMLGLPLLELQSFLALRERIPA